MEQIRALDRGESGGYVNIDYQRMGSFFLTFAAENITTAKAELESWLDSVSEYWT